MSLRYTAPFFEWIDGDGVPAAGWFLYFYATGTDTPLATYSNVGLTIPNTNPVEANADGWWGPIFLQNTLYKVVLKTAAGALIWTADPVDGVTAAAAIQKQAGNYAIDTGAANFYAVTLNPAPSSYTDLVGAPVRVQISNSNTDASTLDVNGLGPKVIYRAGATQVFPGDIRSSAILTFIYNGTQFICQELAVSADMSSGQLTSAVVPNGSVATTILAIGFIVGGGNGAWYIRFINGADGWSGIVTAWQGASAVTAGSISEVGTPGTVDFSVSGTNLQMTRAGGPASVTVQITQIAAA